jgi:hypothetical protein
MSSYWKTWRFTVALKFEQQLLIPPPCTRLLNRIEGVLSFGKYHDRPSKRIAETFSTR